MQGKILAQQDDRVHDPAWQLGQASLRSFLEEECSWWRAAGAETWRGACSWVSQEQWGSQGAAVEGEGRTVRAAGGVWWWPFVRTLSETGLWQGLSRGVMQQNLSFERLSLCCPSSRGPIKTFCRSPRLRPGWYQWRWGAWSGSRHILKSKPREFPWSSDVEV